MAAISTVTATASAVSEPGGWWGRLRQAWTKNDGKPREDWAPGRDLKEIILIVLAVVLVLVQGLVWAWSVLS